MNEIEQVEQDASGGAGDAPETGSMTERTYIWTVRGLYLLLLAGNTYALYDIFKDRPEVVIMRNKLRARLTALQNCEGCARRKRAMAAAANRMMFQATTIVEEAATAAEEEGTS